MAPPNRGPSSREGGGVKDVAKEVGGIVDRPVLVFDGDCGFCTRSVELLDALLPTTAEIVPWQHTDLERLGTSQARTRHEVVWVAPDGHTWGGAQAVARLLIDAGSGWALLGHALRLPPQRWVAWLTYRLVARYRHRLPGGTPRCALVTSSESAPNPRG